MPQELPSKYYLSHFHELVSFIDKECGHLLLPQHKKYLERVRALDENSLCLLLRIYSRQTALVRIKTLRYDEIDDVKMRLDDLLQQALISKPDNSTWLQILHQLTKSELLRHLKNSTSTDLSPTKIKNNAPKSDLLDACIECWPSSSQDAIDLKKTFIVNTRADAFEYLEFLYFGALSNGSRNRITQFSLRDLGVRHTRSDHSESKARFETLAAAQSAYDLAKLYRDIKSTKHTEGLLKCASELKQMKYPIGVQAITTNNKCVLRLYKLIKVFDNTLAIQLLSLAIDCPEAIEREIRDRYAAGETDWAAHRLEDIIRQPLDDDLYVFAQDFINRKFAKANLSIATHMLRSAQTCLPIEDFYRGSVERGVKAHYNAQGIPVYRTENSLWLSLFGLFFWDALYESDCAPRHNEFDFLPPVLAEDCFYTKQAEHIEAICSKVESAKHLFSLLRKSAALHYGKPNGLFQWQPKLLDPIQALVLNVAPERLLGYLIKMSKSFIALSNGYPDLMLLEEGNIRFEEVKASGDKIRRNQLTTIKALKESGFITHITTVKWVTDPNRVYAVVDIETTGGRASQHRITEIGIVKIRNEEVIGEWSTLINPERRIPLKITALTGISNDMVQSAPRFSDIVNDLLAELSNCVFVAHNVNFDYGFIREECLRLGIRFTAPKLCTVVESRRTFPGLGSYSLANLTKHFSIRLDNHHRALADARAAADLLLLIQSSQNTEGLAAV